jgi:hypothetical protein
LRSWSIANRYGQYSETSRPPPPCMFFRMKPAVLKTRWFRISSKKIGASNLQTRSISPP